MKEFEYVSPWSEFQKRSFRVLMRTPCLSQYYTHFYVVCGHFIYVLRRCSRGQYCRWKRGCVWHAKCSNIQFVSFYMQLCIMCSTMRLIFNLYSTFNALFNIQLCIQHSTIHVIFNSLFTHTIIYSTISTIYSAFNFNF